MYTLTKWTYIQYEVDNHELLCASEDIQRLKDTHSDLVWENLDSLTDLDGHQLDMADINDLEEFIMYYISPLKVI